jgi:ribosomal protein S18 acetylase RimI-like enzyme
MQIISKWISTNCKFAMESNESLVSLLAPQGKHPWIGPESGKLSPDGISVLKSKEGSYRYVYCINGKQIACLQVVSTDGKKAHVSNVFTSPEYRRQGIATRLIDRVKLDFQTVTYSEDRSNAGSGWINSLV